MNPRGLLYGLLVELMLALIIAGLWWVSGWLIANYY